MVPKGGAIMPECKNCKSKRVVKNGIVRGKQRYKCKECGYNFVEGDGRTNEKIAAKKAMCVLLYTLSRASYNGLARIFDTWPSLVYRWIVEAGAAWPDEGVPGDIKQIEFDEMWHYVGSKKEKFGSSKPLIVADGELWHGYSAVVILQPSNGSTRKSNT
jgi:transposase